MYKFKSFVLLSLCVLFSVFLISCSENPATSPDASLNKRANSLKKTADAADYSIPDGIFLATKNTSHRGDTAFISYYYGKFEPANGSLGVYNFDCSPYTPKDYHDILGFTKTTCPGWGDLDYHGVADSNFIKALAAGFSPENINVGLCIIGPHDAASLISLVNTNYGWGARSFCADEFLETNWTTASAVNEVATHIEGLGGCNLYIAFGVPDSLSGYASIINAHSCTHALCDTYGPWGPIPYPYYAYPDNMWYHLDSTLGSKFSGAYIHSEYARPGSPETFAKKYETLFSTASNLGLGEIWFYNGDYTCAPYYGWSSNAPEFCKAAWKYGYLRVRAQVITKAYITVNGSLVEIPSHRPNEPSFIMSYSDYTNLPPQTEDYD